MAITPNELRVGNWIQNPEGEIYQSTEYTPLVITRESRIFEGVPLSEEWIENFGFRLQTVAKHDFKFNKVVRTDKLYTTNPFNLDDVDTFEIEVIKDGDDNAVRRIGIKGLDYYDALNIQFVHELQNLYFALTKTELVLQERGEKV